MEEVELLLCVCGGGVMHSCVAFSLLRKGRKL